MRLRCGRRASTIRCWCRPRAWCRCWRWRSGRVWSSAGSALTVPAARPVRPPGRRSPALVAGMVAGADSISDMDLLRHGGMDRLVHRGAGAVDAGHVPARVHVRACPSARRGRRPVPGRPAPNSPLPDRGAAPVTYLDVDDTVRQTYGYAKQGAGYGYTGVKGLNALLATASTRRSAAPVIVATRLRKGSANSARGAARLVADALKTTAVRACTGWWCCGRTPRSTRREVIAAARRHGVALLDHRPQGPRPSPQRSPRSPTTRGRRSATRTRSSTSSCSSGSPTPRSPRSRSPRSPPAATKQP